VSHTKHDPNLSSGPNIRFGIAQCVADLTIFGAQTFWSHYDDDDDIAYIEALSPQESVQAVHDLGPSICRLLHMELIP
jgi:hypothetical protein